LPTHFVSENADENNIVQNLILDPAAMGEPQHLWVDHMALIPRDRAFTELNNWVYAAAILDSFSGLVLASTNGKLENSMLFDMASWNPAPAFECDPAGMNMTVVAVNNVNGDHQLTPRVNIKFRYRPQYHLVP
jgi:hypothetical protein